METQEELKRKRKVSSSFNGLYPIWECPDCGWLNRYIDSFLELCDNCEADHTLDWDQFTTNNGATDLVP